MRSVFKNVGAKAIKLITMDVVFRDTITEQEFLTYYFRFDKKLGPGQTKELEHKIRKGREPDNFRPAALTKTFATAQDNAATPRISRTSRRGNW